MRRLFAPVLNVYHTPAPDAHGSPVEVAPRVEPEYKPGASKGTAREHSSPATGSCVNDRRILKSPMCPDWAQATTTKYCCTGETAQTR